ncbi:MAG: phosphoribosylaminoimidazolesuccinocarboxamide synthase, partial [Phycisphaeraceae bacterium]|nr:phosphoribosylaminoimidazolesuccinocarboxamide synthase [Phycisphaeraceae bacterium]
MTDALMSTDLPYPKRVGKVRDNYDVTLADGTDAIALVATDRLSAFDAVMANGIPDKGRILTHVSLFWFDFIKERLGDRVEHHVISSDPADLPDLDDDTREQIAGRVTIGRRTEVIPIECVVRGYLAGSGWKEYKQRGSICGITLPEGLQESDRLEKPIFTPSTKAEIGEHDENIS